MLRLGSISLFVLIVGGLGMAACSAEPFALPTPTQVVRPPSRTPTALPSDATPPTDVASPNPDNPASATPTSAPTDTPTATPTDAPTPTATPTPTPTPVNLLGGCAPIWQAGYYQLAHDVKTPSYDCFFIQSHDVVFDCDNYSIEGRNFQGYGVIVKEFGFPLLQKPRNVEIKNCRIFNHRNGVLVSGGENIFVHHNDLSNNLDDTDARRFGIFLGKAEGGGLRLDGVKGARVEYNTSNNGAIGIDVRNSERVVVSNNTAVNNSAWGVSFLNTSYSEISNNTTRDNVRYCAWGNGTVAPGCDAGGIVLQDGSSHNVVKNNTVTGRNGNGIFIKAHAMRCGDDNLIQENRILDALWNAIEFSFCKDNKVIGNEIRRSYDAVWFGFSANTEIRNNIIGDMRNHGVISYNSRGSVVTGNTIATSREGIYFYWDIWDAKAFFFLTPSPDRYASRDNLIANNTLHDNAVAGIRLSNSIFNRVENNVLFNNGKNIWLEGRTEGNVIITPTPVPTATRPPTAAPTLTTTAAPTPLPTPTLTATALAGAPPTRTITPTLTASPTPLPTRR